MLTPTVLAGLLALAIGPGIATAVGVVLAARRPPRVPRPRPRPAPTELTHPAPAALEPTDAAPPIRTTTLPPIERHGPRGHLAANLPALLIRIARDCFWCDDGARLRPSTCCPWCHRRPGPA